MDERDIIQPIMYPHQGYTYTSLYFRGLYSTRLKMKIAWKAGREYQIRNVIKRRG